MAMIEPSALRFLESSPQPVDGVTPPDLGEFMLRQATADRLLALPGVDGAWIEQESSGERVVVLHYNPPGRPDLLPRQIDGLRVKVVGGEPIRAGG